MPNNNHFAEAFAADPLLIDPNRIALVNAALEALSGSEDGQKLLTGDLASTDDKFWQHPYDAERSHPFRPYSVSNGVLQISVKGVLLDGFPFQFFSMATGYEYIEKALARGLEDPEVIGIALMVNSPGGTVAGCFECADKIYAARAAKPVIAFAATSAYSAAYALASSAEELVVTRSGGTGSVGVVTTHVDFSEALANEGIKVTFIFAGKHKVEGNAYEALSDSVKARIQDRIDRVYGTFTETVARNRGMDDKAVRATEALSFDAQDSVANGFADRIGAVEEELVAFSKGMTDQEEERLMTTKPDDKATTYSQEQLDAAVAAATTKALADGATAEQNRRSAILGSDAAKTRPIAAAAFVARGLDAETATALLGDMPEEKASEPAPAPAPAAPAAPVQGQTPFDKHMDASGNPEVGANGPAEDDAMDEDSKATASIVGAMKAFRGKAA